MEQEVNEAAELAAATAVALDRADGEVLDKVKKRNLRLLVDPELIQYVRGKVRRRIREGAGSEMARQANGHVGMHVVGAQAVLTFTWTTRAVPPPGVQGALKAGLSLPSGMEPSTWPRWEVETLMFKLWDHRNAVWQRGSDQFCHQLMEAWFPNTPWMEEDLDPAREVDTSIKVPKHRVFNAFYVGIPEGPFRKDDDRFKWKPAPSLKTIFGKAPKPRVLPAAFLPFDPEDQDDEMWVEEWNNRARPIVCPQEAEG